MPAKRRPSKHPPVAQQTPIVAQLLAAADGHKETALHAAAGVGNSYISQIRYGRVVDPGIGAMSRLAAALGYELRLVRVNLRFGHDDGSA